MSAPAAPQGKRITYSRGPIKVAFTISHASTWLPAVALFLCLGLFAMAALILFNVGADPESPQSATVTSVSAQGFQGLRRLLQGRGVAAELNRFEDGPNAAHGDLEIVTLDMDGGTLRNDYAQSSSSDDASNDSASATSDDTSASASSEATAPGMRGLVKHMLHLDEAIPDARRANHLLYHPLGRAVLVIAPKWQADYFPTNTRWAQDAKLVSADDISTVLAILSPVTERPSDIDKEGNPIRPALQPGQDAHVGADMTVIYDKVPYQLARGGKGAAVMLHAAEGQGGFSTLNAGKIDDLQSITGPNLTPVLLGPNGEVLLSRVEVTGGRKATAAPVYLLSDPDLLNNQILRDPQKVIAALGLVDELMPKRKGPGSIVFNLTFNGMAFDHDLLHALTRPPFVGVPLSLLILGLGLMWAAFSRFGPALHVAAEPALGRGVRILADNAARLMALTVREAKLAPAYANLMRDMVLKGRGFMQPSPSQTLDDLADRLGSMCKTTHSFAALKAEAAHVSGIGQLVALTQKLHAWKTEIEHAHK